ncbi:TetR/AcrR family transcriptional regulator [bacterium]|nr:TetR/AcrR family transcriptional regulator [bacterium]
MVSQTDLSQGRVKQKLKTRRELIQAAWELLKQGRQPTVDEVAEQAQVSRATAYRYFPSRERLLIEAVLNREEAAPAEVLAGAEADSPGARASCVQRFLYDHVTNNETLHRSLIRATQEEWIEHKSRFVLRGDQRLSLIQEALKPVAKRLGRRKLSDLTCALAVLMGSEAYIVLRDVCQVSQAQGREIMSWAVGALVEAALDQWK